MKRRWSMLPVVAAIVATVAAQTSAVAQSLKIGSKAPEIKVAKWVKGKPIRSLSDGKTIHVLTFWATWCPTCRDLIPYLTELSQQYRGKVVIAGVAVWERDRNYLSKVENFVRSMGDRMDFAVCADSRPDEKGAMSVNWMKAADQGAIPASFVVSKAGEILWIGSPVALEPVLDKVLAGKFDIDAEAKKQEGARLARLLAQRVVAEAKRLADEGKEAEAVAVIDRALDGNEEIVRDRGIFYNLALLKYRLLLKVDEPKAMSWAAKLYDGDGKDRPELLNALAWFMIEDDSEVKAPDLDLALKMAKRAVELTRESSAYLLDTLAYVLYKKGDVKAALMWQEKAVARLGTMCGDEATNKEIRDRLALYRKKAQ